MCKKLIWKYFYSSFLKKFACAQKVDFQHPVTIIVCRYTDSIASLGRLFHWTIESSGEAAKYTV